MGDCKAESFKQIFLNGGTVIDGLLNGQVTNIILFLLRLNFGMQKKVCR